MSHETDSPGPPNPSKEADKEDFIPVPKYESAQYLPEPGAIRGIRRGQLRDEFGYIRAYFKLRPSNHFTLQRKLNQARFGTTYDIYLTRTVWLSLAVGLVGALLGLLLSFGLIQTGALEGASLPTGVANLPVIETLIVTLAPYKTVIAAALIVVLFGLLFTAATWFSRYYYPYFEVDSRRRNINITLPHVIVYMYALSFGGMAVTEVMKRTAESEATYGEVANEFEMIVKDVELFGNDLYTALRNARNLTPSENLEQFLDDMLSILDSGGNFTTFLRSNSEKYMDEAMREQESFLDTLELLSEVFIIGFVAAPLFVVVTLLMMSLLGGNTLPILYALVYAVIPLGMLGYLVLISTLADPYKQPAHEIPELDEEVGSQETPDFGDNPGYQIYRGIKTRERLKSLYKDPIRLFKNNPLYSLALSIPATVVIMGFLWLNLEAGLDGFFDQPKRFGMIFLALPFLLVTGPLAVFYEYDRRRRKHVARRLPDTLDILASANQMGVSLVEGLEMVARNITGSFATELKRTRNDILWNVDVRRALLSLAQRVRVPQLTRTCNILAEGSRSSGELYKILSIAAEDTRQRYRLERNQRQHLQTYTTVVILGFLVYMGVIVVIDNTFLGMLAETAQESESLAESGLFGFDVREIQIFEALFFHSALVMAVSTGFISGKLVDNEILSGLKYSIGLILVTVIVFFFV